MGERVDGQLRILDTVIFEVRQQRTTVEPMSREEILVDEIDRLNALLDRRDEFIKDIASRANAVVAHM